MLRIRIVTAGAIFSVSLFVAAGTVGTATAQNAIPGKPLQLLKIVEHPSKTKTKPRGKLLAKSSAGKAVKVAAKRRSHTHIAAARRNRPFLPVQAASAPAPDNVWPTVNPLAPTKVAAVAAPAPEPAAAPTAKAPSELVVAGQTVKVASPTDVNEIDLAANNAAAQASEATPASAAASTAAMSEVVEPAPTSDPINAAPAPPGSKVGSTSWILQVLAAFGGAVTAGSVAWFLIGSTPQRTYG